MFLQIKWPDWAALGVSLGSLSVWWDRMPGVVAVVASLISAAWVIRQWLWARKDRKDRK